MPAFFSTPQKPAPARTYLTGARTTNSSSGRGSQVNALKGDGRDTLKTAPLPPSPPKDIFTVYHNVQLQPQGRVI